MISCHIVHPVVQRQILELDQCTVCRQNSRHHRYRQILPVYGMGTRLRNVTSQEVMSGTRLCIPGTNVSTPSQQLISVEVALIQRPKTGSSSRECVAGHETGPRVVEPAKANSGFNAPNFSHNCSLFVRLLSLETG